MKQLVLALILAIALAGSPVAQQSRSVSRVTSNRAHGNVRYLNWWHHTEPHTTKVKLVEIRKRVLTRKTGRRHWVLYLVLGTVVNFTSGSSWTVPGSSTCNLVEIWGGGASGGGGGTSGDPGGSGGGGGGYISYNPSATASTVIAYSIGGGGSGVVAETNGNNGTQTTCSTYSMTAHGGSGGGTAGGSGGAGGTTSGPGGSTSYTGQTGGSGGTNGGNGGNAFGAGGAITGAGGAGGLHTGNTSGSAGSTPGGGGGGGNNNGTNGGSGAVGMIQFTYTTASDPYPAYERKTVCFVSPNFQEPGVEWEKMFAFRVIRNVLSRAA